ncbi:FtsX-like permease family protein [Herbidospora sp. RD11066]
MWHWILLDARARRRSLLVLVLMVAVTCTVVVAVLSGAHRGASAGDRLEEATTPATALVQPNQTGFDWSAVARLPGVAAVYPFRLTTLSSEGPSIGYPPEHEIGVVEHPVLIEGREPTSADETWASPEFLAANGLTIGSQVTVHVGPDKIPQPLRVVGAARSPLMLMYPELRVTPAFAARYAHIETDVPVNAAIRLTGGAAALPAFRENFAVLTNRTDIEILDLAAILRHTEDAAAFEAVVLAALGGTALLAGLLFTAQLAGRHAAGSAPQIRTLRVLGMSSRQAQVAFSAAPVAASAAGTLLGIAAALPLSLLFPLGGAAALEPDPGVYADWPVYPAVAAPVLLAAALGAIIRPGEGRRAHRSTLARLADRARAPVPVVYGMRLAFEPVRPALAGVIAGVAGVIGALTFQAGALDAADDPRRFGQTFELATMTGLDSEEWPTSPADAWTANDAVTGVNDTYMGVLSTGDVSIPVFSYAPLAGKALPTALLAGHMPTDETEIALAPRTAAALGDPDVVAGLRVTGHVLVPKAPHNDYDDGAWVTKPGFDRLFPGGGFTFHFILASVRPGTDPAQLGGDPIDEPQRQTSIRNVVILPGLLGVFLSLLAAGATEYTSGSTVRRNARDFAALRVLGLTPAQAHLTVLSQALALAVAGLVAGVPLGIALGRMTWRVVADLTPVAYVPPTVPSPTLIPAVVAVAMVLAWLPARRAGRLPLGATLRTE